MEMKIPEFKEDPINYDKHVYEYNSYGHDVLFGMSFQYVKPNEKILDLGIGTGLASINYSKLGLKVYGLDSSQEMLNTCESKSFAESLKLYDLNNDSIPYENDYFNHVVCCGVFHFFGDLENLFREVGRVMKKGGVFSFTIAPNNIGIDYEKEDTAWRVPIYKHSIQYIKELLNKNGLQIKKEQRLLVKGADKETFNMLFSSIVAKLE